MQPCFYGFYRPAWPTGYGSRQRCAGGEVPHPYQHIVQTAVTPWGIGVRFTGNTRLLRLHCLYISSRNLRKLKQSCEI